MQGGGPGCLLLAGKHTRLKCCFADFWGKCGAILVAALEELCPKHLVVVSGRRYSSTTGADVVGVAVENAVVGVVCSGLREMGLETPKLPVHSVFYEAVHVIRDLFAWFPTPEAFLAGSCVEEIETVLYPLGLFRKRARALRQLTYDYLHSDWRYPEDLHGCGKYGADSYYLFCKGLWKEVSPDDYMLRKYHSWLLTQAHFQVT